MVSLNGIWNMRCIGQTELQDGVVPGSVYTDLLRNGNMKDPFVGENEDEIRELSEFDYEYERIFSLTKEDLSANQLFLVCEGIDTLAELYVNGIPFGRAENMHRIYRYDIRSLVTEGENTLRIVLYSPLRYVKEADRRKALWGVASTVDGYQHIRKAHSMFGWDWGPQLPDLGIWKNIYIEPIFDGKVTDFYVEQFHKEGDVTLSVQVETECAEPSDLFQVHLYLKDETDRLVYEETRGLYPQQTFTFQVENPELWWPNGYGRQPLYELGVLLTKENNVISSKIKKIGLRTLTIQKEKDGYGESFGFNINGIVIFATGANYIPEDNLLGRTSKERTKKLLESCIRANYNCIRIWGGGNYGSDDFYDLCDELGLIVWQDFMFACAVYDLTESFEANIRQEFEDNIRRLRNHASLGIWCGNNEMEIGWAEWNIKENEKLRQDYLTMFERILPEMVRKYDPQRFYWPASPSSGGGFHDPNSEKWGDAHYWEVWHGLKPFEEFEQKYFRFASEYGFQSIPSIKTIQTFVQKEEYNLFSNVMEKHQKCTGIFNGNIMLMSYLYQYYQEPKDFETLIYVSQILQGDCLDIAISHFRRNRGRCLGSTYWQVNDCNPVISWATIDYYGRWKAAHYIVKRRYAPLIASAKVEGDNVAFYVANDTRRAFSGGLQVTLMHQQNGTLFEHTEGIRINALSAECVHKIKLPELGKTDKRQCYLVYRLIGGIETIDEQVMLLVKPKQFTFMKPNISIVWREEPNQYILTLNADVYTRRVGIEFEHIDVILSDNYFDLIPHMDKVIYLKKEDIYSHGIWNDEPIPWIGIEELQNQLKLYSNYNIIY